MDWRGALQCDFVLPHTLRVWGKLCRVFVFVQLSIDPFCLRSGQGVNGGKRKCHKTETCSLAFVHFATSSKLVRDGTEQTGNSTAGFVSEPLVWAFNFLTALFRGWLLDVVESLMLRLCAVSKKSTLNFHARLAPEPAALWSDITVNKFRYLPRRFAFHPVSDVLLERSQVRSLFEVTDLLKLAQSELLDLLEFRPAWLILQYTGKEKTTT